MPAVTGIRRAASAVLLVALLAIHGPTQLAAAPDDQEVQQVEQQQEPEEGEINGAGMMDLLAQFDATIFQPDGSVAAARSHIDGCLKVQIDELERACSLSEAQRQKLRLAAEGDAKRFFDEVNEVRRQYEGKTADAQNPNAFDQIWGEMWQRIQPLRMKFQAGIFGEASLFSKVIAKTLTPDQITSYRAVTDSRRQFRRQAEALTVMAQLEKFIPLDDSQHEALLKVLLDDTQPQGPSQERDSWLQLYWLATVPLDKLRPIFDERQAKQFKRLCDQFGGLRPFMIGQGVIPDLNAEDPAEE